jgi:uncharacterized protein YxjI
VGNSILLDPEREYYVIKEKLWDWGGGEIYDERGSVIGRMKRKFISLRALITVSEPDGKPVLTVNRKLASVRSSYDIKDENGNLLGRTRKKILSFIRPKMWMEDALGNRVLEAQGSFAGWNFSIRDATGRPLAEVSKADRWRDVFLGGLFDYSDTYALRILDKNYDRRVLLGFVVAIDNSVHDR